MVVGGWVLRYLCQFIFVGDFGGDPSAFFQAFTTDPVAPIIWSMILLVFVSVMMFLGITNSVEKLSKYMMPTLIVMFSVCGVYACTISEGAMEGPKYYPLPNFEKLHGKSICRCSYSGSVLGRYRLEPVHHPWRKRAQEEQPEERCSLHQLCGHLRRSAGFVIIPCLLGAGIDVQKGPALVFEVMSGIFPEPSRRPHNWQLLLLMPLCLR